jgi:hypothetical protein
MTRQRYLFRERPTGKETDVAFPDRQLANDEQVVKHLHPHWVTLVLPVFAFLVTVGLGGFLVAIVPAGGTQNWLRLAIGVVALIVLIWFVLVPVLKWKTTHRGGAGAGGRGAGRPGPAGRPRRQRRRLDRRGVADPDPGLPLRHRDVPDPGPARLGRR